MRKITKLMQDAVNGKYDFKLSNTEVQVYHSQDNFNNDIYVYLHNNNIFKHEALTGDKIYSSCGWYSNTTKERLNALMPEGFAIVQRDWSWYIINSEGLYMCWYDGITAEQIEDGVYVPLKELN